MRKPYVKFICDELFAYLIIRKDVPYYGTIFVQEGWREVSCVEGYRIRIHSTCRTQAEAVCLRGRRKRRKGNDHSSEVLPAVWFSWISNLSQLFSPLINLHERNLFRINQRKGEIFQLCFTFCQYFLYSEFHFIIFLHFFSFERSSVYFFFFFTITTSFIKIIFALFLWNI